MNYLIKYRGLAVSTLQWKTSSDILKPIQLHTEKVDMYNEMKMLVKCSDQTNRLISHIPHCISDFYNFVDYE